MRISTLRPFGPIDLSTEFTDEYSRGREILRTLSGTNEIVSSVRNDTLVSWWDNAHDKTLSDGTTRSQATTLLQLKDATRLVHETLTFARVWKLNCSS